METELIELSDTIDQRLHGFTKLLFNVLRGNTSIFDGIMQQSCNDGFFVEVHLRNDGGHSNRVDDVRLT